MSTLCPRCDAKAKRTQKRCQRPASCRVGCNNYCWQHAEDYRRKQGCKIKQRRKTSSKRQNANVRVAPSLNPRAGRGLFAVRSFDTGETIANLEGTIKPYDKVPEKHYGYLVAWKQDEVLDTLDGYGESLGRFANSTHQDPHKRRANARITLDRRNKRARLKATRNIAPGKEILIHYGDTFFD